MEGVGRVVNRAIERCVLAMRMRVCLNNARRAAAGQVPARSQAAPRMP